jgi:hypothetical protein
MRMGHSPRPAVLALALLGLSASLGCGTGDVVVAKVSTPGGAGKPCASTSECPEDQYCEIGSCDADGGTCQVPPSSCTDQGQLPQQCGCDGGVTYWSDCVRRQNLVTASQPCTDIVPSNCGPTSPCPLGSCNQGTTKCDGNASITGLGCWVLPATCPTDGVEKVFTACGDATQCQDLCTAIRNEQPFAYAGPPFGCQ